MIIRQIVFESKEIIRGNEAFDFPFIIDTLRRLGGFDELGDIEDESVDGRLTITFTDEDM